MAAEKNFENKVKKYLLESGCWILKYWGGASYTKSGIPDLLVCCSGMFIGIELKSPSGKPTELQIYNLRKIDEAGGYGILLYPKDFDLFRQMVDNLIMMEKYRMHQAQDHTAGYDHFRQIRKEWEEKLSVTVQVN